LFATASYADQQSISRRQFGDPSDSADMFDGLIEEHQIHLSLQIVVFIQFLLHDPPEFGELFYGGVVLAHEGGEDDGLSEGVFFLVEVADGFGDGVFQDGSEEVQIIVVDKSVLEYSSDLMIP
jgi:hypothetical protein